MHTARNEAAASGTAAVTNRKHTGSALTRPRDNKRLVGVSAAWLENLQSEANFNGDPSDRHLSEYLWHKNLQETALIIKSIHVLCVLPQPSKTGR